MTPLPWRPTLGVVVCAYTPERLPRLHACLVAITEQLLDGDELVVVIDHHAGLLDRVRELLPDLLVVENRGRPGLSAARTTGSQLVAAEVVVFVDDDAVPQPGWADALRARLTDPAVVGVAGAVEADLGGDVLPFWFPAEFGWVIGCDYRGLPASGRPVRNPIGANMAVRRAALIDVGGFDPALGRVGALPAGCEETELFVRLRAGGRTAVVVRDTAAQVRHWVPPQRRTVRYFVRRCWHEGRSKAVLVGLAGSQDGLSSERRQLVVLARAVGHELGSVPVAGGAALARAVMIMVGTLVTALGYVSGRPSGSSFVASVDGTGVQEARQRVDLSLVVCTLGRSEQLPATIASLLEQRLAVGTVAEIVVVDNDPASGLVRQRLAAVAGRVQIVDASQRGLSAARNAGLAAARGRIVAFTDDDATADPDWAQRLLDVFDEPGAEEVDCVTGLVRAVETDSDTSRWFEEYGGFGKGADRLAWVPDAPGPDHDHEPAALGRPGPRGVAFPCSAGEFGSGNNMAFRTDRLRRLGGFDPALGAGSPSLGGEDLDIFRRVFTGGGVIVYEPAAVIRHHHRSTYADLRAQLFAYGAGMAAVITKQLTCGPGSALAVLVRLGPALVLLLHPRSAKNNGKSDDFPAELTRAELLGYLAGPLRYLRARWARR